MHSIVRQKTKFSLDESCISAMIPVSQFRNVEYGAIIYSGDDIQKNFGIHGVGNLAMISNGFNKYL
ncbi:MAG: hypothetical protein K0Q49_914 [Haloplasmataceae bacterium]|jgi:hypothetical protein|nr:hypothetical protein [Haloplasmataceae bacterium]